MHYISRYASPLGEMLLAAGPQGLTGLWFAGQKYFARGLTAAHKMRETALLTQAKAWLDSYFAGKNPPLALPLHFVGTPFQKAVWGLLCVIPYGQTTTYGAIARQLAGQRGCALACRAVGGAVGRNALAIMAPCHRVVAANGSLQGYAAGLAKKRALLALEQGKSLFRPA